MQAKSRRNHTLRLCLALSRKTGQPVQFEITEKTRVALLDWITSAKPKKPMVTVTKDGPYAITGGIELLEQSTGEGASTEHYTLCRCGGSENKPFCDGAHWSIGFKDENS